MLMVTSDVEDEVHVHGYDLVAEVAPDQPAHISFHADFAGEFEVELEESTVPIAELSVTRERRGPTCAPKQQRSPPCGTGSLPFLEVGRCSGAKRARPGRNEHWCHRARRESLGLPRSE
jgi:hypothetical protein